MLLPDAEIGVEITEPAGSVVGSLHIRYDLLAWWFYGPPNSGSYGVSDCFVNS